jgi:hypothetical protein
MGLEDKLMVAYDWGPINCKDSYKTVILKTINLYILNGYMSQKSCFYKKEEK